MSQSTFVYKLSLTPKYHDLANWDAQTQKMLGEHAEYLRAGVESGRVLIVARTDTALKDNFGIAVFKAENLEDANTFMKNDPAIRHGIMTAVVYPFKILMVTEEASKGNVW